MRRFVLSANSAAPTQISHAAILAGGRSRRFGSDKLTATVDGVAMLERVVATCRAAGLSPLVVGRVPDGAATWKGVRDREPGQGPLSGLVTALQELRADVLMLAGDLPFLSADFLRFICANATDAAATIVRSRNGIEPCCGVYRYRALSVALDHLQRGQRAMHRFAEALPATSIDVPAQWEGNLHNVNYPQDLLPTRIANASET